MMHHGAIVDSPLPTKVLIIVVAALVIVSLSIGMLGYWLTEGLGAADCFLEASMILAGEGPFSSLTQTSGKVFAGFYALYSGLVFLIVLAILIAIIWRRLSPQPRTPLVS